MRLGSALKHCCANLLLILGAGCSALNPNEPPPDPEAATGRGDHALATASTFMASTANPLATRTAFDILAAGGSAADAAIAAQWVLTLVEPQSSGIGGGGFILAYDKPNAQLAVYDARETAPAHAQKSRFHDNDSVLDYGDAVNSGLSVGVPGLLHGLALMHKEHGRLPWATLFEPAIRLAESGFAVSPRLHTLVSGSRSLYRSDSARSYFYAPNGKPWPVGHTLKNPALAALYRRIAAEGVDAFYRGPVAQAVVQAVQSHDRPGDLSLTDLAAYRPIKRQALCAPYLAYRLCGPPPPSSGPIAVMQILSILEHTPILDYAPDSAQAVHYFAEAGKLAYADRDIYIADPAFVPVPVQGLLDPDYLQQRAQLIRPDHAIPKARPGQPPGADLARFGTDNSPDTPSTTHVSIVDANGNAVSMTTSVESAFGSKLFVHGFLLNNQLTDFSLAGVDEHGRPLANRVEPGKRPKSAMSPMMVFKDDALHMAIGAPGGTAIINYVAKTLLGVLGYGLDIQQAINLPNRGSRNYGTEIEADTSLTGVVATLKAMGHRVTERAMPSGLQGVVRTPDGRLYGGADPRREGLALGQ
ncbi:gamma-glutamyltransferase [Pusillimonas minor]|uniref:Glutathione hydrolase proenzyme n=1 Tax=Pusillimonas minor TaxID=2697024 RepID=A0A842HLR4_9BURK|nr:gamma-glutamyltransferase [Pusillimonas minor]MBC2769739.1 gamma-glutamyltransferase [Pusillimonas minor]